MKKICTKCPEAYNVVSSKGRDSLAHVSKQIKGKVGGSTLPDLPQKKIANGKIGGGGSDSWHNTMHKDSDSTKVMSKLPKGY